MMFESIHLAVSENIKVTEKVYLDNWRNVGSFLFG